MEQQPVEDGCSTDSGSSSALEADLLLAVTRKVDELQLRVERLESHEDDALGVWLAEGVAVGHCTVPAEDDPDAVHGAVMPKGMALPVLPLFPFPAVETEAKDRAEIDLLTKVEDAGMTISTLSADDDRGEVIAEGVLRLEAAAKMLDTRLCWNAEHTRWDSVNLQAADAAAKKIETLLSDQYVSIERKASGADDSEHSQSALLRLDQSRRESEHTQSAAQVGLLSLFERIVSGNPKASIRGS